MSELADERDLGSRAERRPGSSPGFPTTPGGGPLVVALVPLLTLGLLALTGCGLLGGGVSEEEFLALQQQLSTTKQMLETTDRDVSAKQVRLAELGAELKKIQTETAAAASEGKIPLERARLDVRKYAQENLAVYGPVWGNVPLIWEIESAEEDEEFYYIKLTYRPFQNFDGTPGTEEFITDKTGKIEFRQVLTEPDPDKPLEPKPPPEGG